MRLLGFDITRAKAAPQGLQSPGVGSGGWWPIIREPFAGAWQRNLEIKSATIITFSAVYANVTLISSDVAKIGLRLVQKDDDDIWAPVESSAFSPVLRKPNRYQNRIKFIEQWVVSKLLHGNTYVLKERDNRDVVVAMYVLDPTRTKVLIAPDGAVYYELSKDNLSGVEGDRVIVPAREIIHDTMVPLYHPLCGVSPLTACGLAAVQGLSIQGSSTKFFENGAKPGGVLTAPGTIDDVTAARFKKEWEERFSGNNAGRVAILGDGLKYESMTVNAVDAQLIEQLKWSAETVCSCFHVPPYMIGVGPMPTYNNIEALNQQYYTQCLQSLIENIELCLDEGLGLVDVKDKTYGTEFDLDDLLRMDTATQIRTWGDAVKGTLLSPNEARKKIGYGRVPGGDAPLSQQQNYSLQALAKRDSQDDPFKTSSSAAAPATPAAANNNDEPTAEDIADAAKVAAWAMKSYFNSAVA